MHTINNKNHFIVTGMTCAACQGHVERTVKKVSGVSKVSVSLLTNSMIVEGTAGEDAVVRAVEKAGYGASPMEDPRSAGSPLMSVEEEALKDRETPRLAKRLIWSALFLVLLMYITMGHNMLSWPVPSFLDHNHLGLALSQMLLSLFVLGINRDFFISGFRSLSQGAPNMDVLVAMGSGISFLWSLCIFYRMTWLITNGVSNMNIMPLYHDQLYFESAAMIPALITVGKLLEALSKGRTTDALKSLMKMVPKEALLLRNGEEIRLPASEVRAGDIFLVKPGEAVPVDGEILSGTAALDESALTGESVPVDKGVGDAVRAASINTNGHITAKATRVGEDTSFSQIIRMVSEAAATKAPIARMADRVSAVFVPAVIGIAVLVFAVHLAWGSSAREALTYAISVLLISCPCALGLATPVAIMVGNGLGAKHGILFKTSEAMEMTGRVQIAALDKTGTLTEGAPCVTDIVPEDGISEDELLQAAYALEKKSEHPLARAIADLADERGIKAEKITDFLILPGKGLTGKQQGKTLAGGSFAYITSLADTSSLRARADALAEEGKTPLLFMQEGVLLGLIAVADVLRKDSARAVQELHAMGIEVVMLTGDNEKTARAIGQAAGVDTILSGILPDGKEAAVRKLAERGRVLMIGDGINDAPALTRADVGMAIGGGTDVAIDSADVVLMNSRLTDATAAIRLSRKTLRNIHENLFWAFAYNALLIPLAAGLYTGISLNPMWAAAAMSLSSFTVCLNALRLTRVNIHDATHDKPIRHRASVRENEAALLKEESSHCAIIHVEGMMCENCEAHVKKALETLPSVTCLKADAKTGEAKIRYTLLPREADLRKVRAAADYQYVSIQFPKEENEMKETVKIKGMMCGHCEMAVKKALEALDGVEKAEVSHETGTAVLTLSKEIPDADIKKAVEDKDYTFEGIEK